MAAKKPKTVTGADFVNEEAQFIGDPYEFGAAGPTAFDCSGLQQFSLGQLGITAPRTSEEQWAWVSQFQDASALAPGDLIFEQWPGDGSPPGHVALYAGNGQVIEAPAPGQAVHERAWSDTETQIIGYGRVPGVNGAPDAAVTSASGGGGFDWNPLSWPGQAVSAATGGITGTLTEMAVLVPIVLGAAALGVWGLIRASGAGGKAKQAAQTAAPLAAAVAA
jgi:hypothetical protein